ncbi:FAD:protein FMN transferase [Herbaspirillum sp. RV1423]|uniref:FAD:protein FMN transferase n=1 Tax=Herbaspirillum sp. RV1423 TaxID=1443993 RepID=UPI0004B6C864|nr:FAD:protein FMN transferase [Herbaspirillum sp. RV1423]
MGTRYTAVFYAPAAIDAAAVDASLSAAVDKVDRQMSTWNPMSDLCRVNAAPENTWISIPDELAHVLETGLQVGLESQGAFDIGVGALVDAWGFGPSQAPVVGLPTAPPGMQLSAGAASLDVDRKGGQVRKRAPIRIDLSGIAKGYGVDQLAHCLERWGIASYLVGIDGEMLARGSKPGGQAWTVAIEKPTYGVRELAGTMELIDAAIASSGDYRHWVEIAGKRYSHTMNPVLQQPSTNRVAGVTVLGATCMLADAWATALLVLGEHDGVKLARERDMDALFTLRDGERLEEIWVTGGRAYA